MPTSRIISRIQQIESRIEEIKKIGQPKTQSVQKNKSIETNTKPANGESFSQILDEIMKSKTSDQLNLFDENTDISPSSMLANRTNSLLELYKSTGTMPTAQAKPIPGREIRSNNPGTWDNIITETAKKMDLDPNLIHAVIQAESAYNPQAVSRAGAEGLMQLMPYTAERIGVTDSFDPEQNIWGGSFVLKEMLEMYNGDLIKALAAYNAGPEAVNKARGIPNYKETQEYVPRVLNYYYNLRR